MLRSAGFDAQLRHSFRRWPLSWLNTVNVRLVNVALFRLRAFFILAGSKP